MTKEREMLREKDKDKKNQASFNNNIEYDKKFFIKDNQALFNYTHFLFEFIVEILY